jgi:transposase
MARPKKYPDEFRRRAVDEVFDRGLREAPTSEELAEIKKLRREVADQQRTIEILKAATALFVQEQSPRLPLGWSSSTPTGTGGP